MEGNCTKHTQEKAIRVITQPLAYKTNALTLSYYCQLESDMHLPQAGPFDDINGSRSQLQDTLKSKVQQRGGNAIVFGQCYISAHADTDCQKALSCEGFAYQVEY